MAHASILQEIKTDFDGFIRDRRAELEKCKIEFHTEPVLGELELDGFMHYAHRHFQTHKLQKNTLVKLIELIKILSPYVQKYNDKYRGSEYTLLIETSSDLGGGGSVPITGGGSTTSTTTTQGGSVLSTGGGSSVPSASARSEVFQANYNRTLALLALLTDIIIWVSDNFIHTIMMLDDEIKRMDAYLKSPNRPDDVTVMTIFLETIKVDRTDFEHLFRNYNDETKTIQYHWVRVLSNQSLLDRTPSYIWQVFKSSMFLGELGVVQFLIDNYKKLPLEYRINIYQDKKYTKNIIEKRFDIEVMINDVDFLFASCHKNPENVSDIYTISFLICDSKQIRLDLDESKSMLTRFISILLTIIAKLDLEKKNSDPEKEPYKVATLFTNTFIDCICKILDLTADVDRGGVSSYPLLDSYLVYSIPSILNGLYGQNEMNDLCIDKLISKVSTNRMMVIYMAATCPNVKFSVSSDLDKWKKIFEQVESDKDFGEISDELLGTCVINPCYLPNDILVDRYIIESTLWEKPKNPYNRDPLKIDDLDRYNKTEEVQKKIKKTEDLKKEVIRRYKPP